MEKFFFFEVIQKPVMEVLLSLIKECTESLLSIIREIQLSEDNDEKACYNIICNRIKEWMDNTQCTSFLREHLKKFEEIN